MRLLLLNLIFSASHLALATPATRHAHAGLPPDELAVRAPAVPLIVTDAFFSQWSPADNLANAYTRHWTMIFGGGWKVMSALARIDGVSVRLLGLDCPPGATPPLPQLGFSRVYASSTVTRFAGAGVAINLTFTQPVFGDGAERGEGLPHSYVVFDVASTDGRGHEVQLYFDATAQLVTNEDSEEVEWARVPLATPGAAALRIGSSCQSRFDGNGDDFRIDWGHLHLAAAGDNVAAASASSNRMRTFFVSNGTLPPDETYMPVPTCLAANNNDCKCMSPGGSGPANDWPALALAWTLAVPADGSPVSAFGVAAYDDLELGAARFFGAPQSAYWRSLGRSIEALLDDALQRFDEVMALSVAGDVDTVARLRAAGLGEAYERLASLSYRQTLGANKLAWYGGDFPLAPVPELHVWVKGSGSSGDTGTLDDNLPAVPFMLWARPHMVPGFLAPLFMWAANQTTQGADAPFPRNMTFNEAFAPHYLGQHPDAELQCWENPPGNHCEQMPIEMSASAIQIVAAYSLQTGNYSFAERFWGLLERWAQYLAANGLFPAEQRSSDDYEGPISNSTHLAAKAAIGLGAFSQLCNATGRQAIGASYWSTAVAMRDAWLVLARDPAPGAAHYALQYGAANTSSVKYSFLFDRALGLDLFSAAAAAECEYLASDPATALPFGWVLQRNGAGGDAARWTNLGWLGFMLAVCPAQAPLLAQQLLGFANATQPRYPLTDWYDASDASYVGFAARAQVGGVFAPVWVQGLRARAVGGS